MHKILRSLSAANGNFQCSDQILRSWRSSRSCANASAASSASAAKEKKDKRWGWLLLLPAGFAGFLGCWQVGRYQWKVEVLNRKEAGFRESPRSLAEITDRAGEYSRVAAKGVFQHEKSIYIGPRPRTVMGTSTAGYTLITPLMDSEGASAALVNRGWVPAEWRSNPKLRSIGSPEGEVEVVGLVRDSENRSGFVPNNNPDKGEWFWIDVPAMTSQTGLPRDSLLIEVYDTMRDTEGAEAMPSTMDVLAFQAKTPKQNSLYPLPKTLSELMRVSVMPVDHRNYALTWFSLSGATAYLAYKALKKPVARK